MEDFNYTSREVGIRNVRFGSDATIIEPSNIYGCKIGDGCFIGPFVEIQKDVIIGDRTRVQSHSFICSKVKIGHDCFIGHGVMFINDTFSKLGGPAYDREDLWRPACVGNGVTIGSGATILPVKICDNALIGAGAVVTKDIERSGVYVGNPASFLKELK